MKNFDYNYDNYMDDYSAIVYAIEKSNIKYDLIGGIQRGGLVPAVHLSNVFNAEFAVLNWSSKPGKIRDCHNFFIVDAINRYRKGLLVDDICDTGVTFKQILQTYRGVHTASLVYNNINTNNFTPTYHGWEINRNDTPEWIDFWWEKK